MFTLLGREPLTGKGCYPAQCILVPGPCNMDNKESIFGTMDN